MSRIKACREYKLGLCTCTGQILSEIGDRDIEIVAQNRSILMKRYPLRAAMRRSTERVMRRAMCNYFIKIITLEIQSTYPYNDNLYNDITSITIFSCQTKSLCTVYIQFFTLITIWPITIIPI